MARNRFFTRVLQLVIDKASVELTNRRMQAALKKGTDPKEALKNIGAVHRQFNGLRNLALHLGGALGSIFAIHKVREWADTWRLVNGRLKLVTTSSENLREVQAEIFEISQRTRTEYEATAALFQRVALQSEQLGRSQGEILQLTETVQKSIQLSGAGQQEAAAGVIQFSQALAAGVLRGDEFRSVMENLPGLARTIADGLGVPVGQLRAMANAGELTANRVVAAILKMRDSVDQDFRHVPVTIGQAFTVLRNEGLRFVGMRDEVTGASSGIANAILSIAEAVEPTGRALDGFFRWFERQVENLAKLGLDEDALEALFEVERVEAIVDRLRAATPDRILAEKIQAERVGDSLLVSHLNALLDELGEKANAAWRQAQEAQAAAAEAARLAAEEAAKKRREEEDKRLAHLVEARELEIAMQSETMELIRLHGQVTAELQNANLKLEERIRLQQRLNAIEAAVPALGEVRRRVLPGDPRDLGAALGVDEEGKPLEVQPMQDTQALAEHFRDTWIEAHREVQAVAERAALGIAGAWQDAFESVIQEGAGFGGFLEAIFRGATGAALGALADLASAKVVENIARAFEALGMGSAQLLLGNVAAPAVAGQSAGFHFAAAAKWAVIGGAAAAIQSGVAGGGRGGASGGLSSGARDPVARGVDRTRAPGPELHVHFVGPGFDATNPTVQRVVHGAQRAAEERYGSNVRVRVHRDSQ